MLPILDVQVALNKLGYFAGPIDGDYHAEGFRDDLRRFQRDYPACGNVDGWYGLRTDAVLAPMAKQAQQRLPSQVQSCRRWRVSRYYVGNARQHGRGNVPIWSSDASQPINLNVAPAAYVELALNGSSVLQDGTIVNVSGWTDVRPTLAHLFKPVLEIAKRNHWIPNHVGYAGIRVSNDRLTVTHVRTFVRSPRGPKGYPFEHQIECDPFRTVAADLGTLLTHDPSFRGKGGVVPVGTRAFLLELAGVRLPDDTFHDGWVTVNDTGGAIVGAHFDLFTGSKILSGRVRLPELMHVWFEGMEDKLPYHYGVGI